MNNIRVSLEIKLTNIANYVYFIIRQVIKSHVEMLSSVVLVIDPDYFKIDTHGLPEI